MFSKPTNELSAPRSEAIASRQRGSAAAARQEPPSGLWWSLGDWRKPLDEEEFVLA
jgi:hypothetical protein